MPDPAPTTVADSAGTTFVFGGTSFVAKNVKVKNSRPLYDTTPLSSASGFRSYQGSSLMDVEITCEYWGSTAPVTGVRTEFTCSLANGGSYAVCESFEITAAVGELLVGNAVFKVCQ